MQCFFVCFVLCCFFNIWNYWCLQDGLAMLGSHHYAELWCASGFRNPQEHFVLLRSAEHGWRKWQLLGFSSRLDLISSCHVCVNLFNVNTVSRLKLRPAHISVSAQSSVVGWMERWSGWLVSGSLNNYRPESTRQRARALNVATRDGPWQMDAANDCMLTQLERQLLPTQAAFACHLSSPSLTHDLKERKKKQDVSNPKMSLFLHVWFIRKWLETIQKIIVRHLFPKIKYIFCV